MEKLMSKTLLYRLDIFFCQLDQLLVPVKNDWQQEGCWSEWDESVLVESRALHRLVYDQLSPSTNPEEVNANGVNSPDSSNESRKSDPAAGVCPTCVGKQYIDGYNSVIEERWRETCPTCHGTGRKKGGEV